MGWRYENKRIKRINNGNLTLQFILIASIVLTLAQQHPKINEVFLSPRRNQVDPENVEDFIEIWGDPGTGTMKQLLQNYALLFVENGPSRIVGYVEIGSTFIENESERRNLFVISRSSYVPNTEGLLSSDWVKPEDVGAILLIRKPTYVLEEAVRAIPSPANSPIEITVELQLAIANVAVDAILLSSDISQNSIWFNSILQQWKGLPKMLPLGDDEVLDNFSLNQCVSSPFDSSSYWYGAPTPGLLNICKIDSASDTAAYSQLLFHTSIASSTCEVPKNVADEISDITSQNPVNMPLKTFLTTNSQRIYLVYVRKPKPTEANGIRCQVCYLMKKSISPTVAVHTASHIVQDHGQRFVPSDQSKMLSRLKKHVESAEHLKVVEATGKRCLEPNEDDDQNTKMTARKIGLVFLETTLGMALRSHQRLMEGLEVLGYDVGDDLNTRYSATSIVGFISAELHREMLDYMLKSDTPFSLLLDSSTDIAGYHGTLLYFMFIEEGRPVVKVWHYVESKDSSGKGMGLDVRKLAIRDERQHPGFTRYFMLRCASVATDGASNMVGKYNSLITELTAYIRLYPERSNRPLQSYHCANHRLALAYNDVIYSKDTNLQFCRKITEHCNHLASFYAVRSYKKRNQLKEQADTIDEEVRRFRRILKVRWMPATHEAYRVIDQNYKTFIAHLKEICKEDNPLVYSTDARIEASTLLAVFSDKNLLATFNHHLDVVAEMSYMAKYFERKVNNVIDVNDQVDRLRQTLETLLVTEGTQLSSFLKEAKCDSAPCNTVEKLERSENVVFRGNELNKDAAGIPALSSTHNLLTHAILESLEKRFPTSATSAFKLLNHKNILSVQAGEWNVLSNYLQAHYGLPGTSNDFVNLQKALRESQLLTDENKAMPPEQFWSKILTETEMLPHDSAVRNAVKLALVQPAGTASVESGFSFLNAIKDKSRNALNIKTVADIFRIKFNGPTIKNFQRYSYARKWLSSGHGYADAESSDKRSRIDTTTENPLSE